MPRMAAGKGLELEMFWRTHLDGWRRSPLNQREYCELHGLPLKWFGNWRAKATQRHRPICRGSSTSSASPVSPCTSSRMTFSVISER
jgi:hypothetical protein